MGATAILSPLELAVEPGQIVTAQIRVRNAGQVVDQFTFELLGDPQAWVVFDPPSLSLLPDSEGIATISFEIPAGSVVPAGTYPFAVKVNSKEDPIGSVAEEGTLLVGGIRDLFVEVLPRTNRAKRVAAYEVAVDNRGNQRLNAELSAVDPNNALRFRFAAPALVVDPNTATLSKLAVAPVKRFLRGPNRTLPFQVVLNAPPGPPLAADAVLLHEALLPKWLLKALIALLLLALLLVILWFTLLRPAIKSAAKQAVATPLASASAQAAQLSKAQQAAAAQQGAQAANQGQQAAAVKQLQDAVKAVNPAFSPLPVTAPAGGGGGGGGVVGPGGTILPGTGTGVTATTVAGRLSSSVGPGKTANGSTYTVPTSSSLAITDIILENPGGDSGTLTLQQGTTPLLQVNLDNFRDLDYHFVSPPTLAAGQSLVLNVACANVATGGQPAKVCTPGVFYSGNLTQH